MERRARDPGGLLSELRQPVEPPWGRAVRVDVLDEPLGGEAAETARQHAAPQAHVVAEQHRVGGALDQGDVPKQLERPAPGENAELP
ncbi:MAG TPA: hypothetical protein VGS23_06210, partial [Thermoplasmata archaeon]|nr:hypothetical protein [Thermoplasmata archaeon]